MNERIRPPAELKARLMAAAAAEPATAPGTWGRRVAITVAIGAGWLAAMLLMKGVRPDWRQLPPGAWWVTVGALALSAVAATAVALRRGPAMVGAGARALSALVWGLPLAMVVLVSLVDPCGPATERAAEGERLARATACIGMTTLVALPLIGLGLMLFRGLTLSRPGTIGACVGLAAATWAHAVVRLHCPLGGVEHALLGHVLPALPLMILAGWGAWALDRRHLRPRPR